MEKTLSKSAVDNVILDQITWWETELRNNDRQLLEMEQRFRDNTCTLDGLILYKHSYADRRADMMTRLMELNNISNAIDRL
jgi:hypothetical protein